MERFILTGPFIGAAAAALLTACGQSQSTGMTQPIAASTAQVQTVRTEETSPAAGETAAGNTTAGNMAGAENIAAEETTAAGGALAPSETAQTSYPLLPGTRSRIRTPTAGLRRNRMPLKLKSAIWRLPTGWAPWMNRPFRAIERR